MSQMRIDRQTPCGRVVGRTDVGLKRQTNQDSFDVVLADDRVRLLLCDGMGGHSGGEKASRIAIEIAADAQTPIERVGMLANDAVGAEGRTNGPKGMGTTLVGLEAATDGEAIWTNVGDSRLYRMRAGMLEQISDDHSVVGDLLRSGSITPEEAAVHPKRNVLTMALGVTPTVEPQVGRLDLADGDLLMLSSDGLHGMIDDRSIERILAADWDLAARCDSLIEAALDAGGADNVTLLLLEVRIPRSRSRTALPSSTPWLLVPLLLALFLLVATIFATEKEPTPYRPPVDTLDVVPDSLLQPTPGEGGVVISEDGIDTAGGPDTTDIRNQLPWGDLDEETAR